MKQQKRQWTRTLTGTAWLFVVAAAGCSSDSGDTGTANNSAAGTTASNTGSAGTTAGSGTDTAGNTTMPTAGMSAGAAGESVAAAGSGTGTGMDTGAAGAAGDAAAEPSGDFACGAASTKTPAELYDAAAMAFLPPSPDQMLPCAFGSCHNDKKHAASLVLQAGGNLQELLVDKPACEAPSLMLVDSSGGDAALAKSFLYLKLAAPVDGSANLIAQPEWGDSASCGQSDGFGVRMPQGGGVDGVGAEKIAIMREWICAGAPGPM